MSLQITMKSPSGMEAVARNAGGKWSVGDRVMVYINDNCIGMGDDTCKPAIIKKLYKRDTETGVREFADVLFDGSDKVSEGYYSMFFNEIITIKDKG